MKHKLLYFLSIFTIFVTFGLILLVIYWLIYPFKPLIYHPTTLPVLNKIVHKGDPLVYKISYCRNTDEVAYVYRQFVDTILIPLPKIEARGVKGCREIISNTILIPENISYGTVHYEMIVEVKVNPIRKIFYELRTEDFEIIEATSSAILK